MKVALLVIAILFTVVAVIWAGIGTWMISRDVDRVLDRAQVAADAKDMLADMQKVEANMADLGMTHGHTALVFKTDLNDVGKQYAGVKAVIARLEKIENLDTASTTYQVALDDIRGIIREIPRMAGGWFYVTVGWILLLVGIILWVITGVSWLLAESY